MSEHVLKKQKHSTYNLPGKRSISFLFLFESNIKYRRIYQLFILDISAY